MDAQPPAPVQLDGEVCTLRTAAGTVTCCTAADLGKQSISPYALPAVSIQQLVHNAQHAKSHLHGGQAKVHLCSWRPIPQTVGTAAAWSGVPIEPGTSIAIKHMQCPRRGGSGGFADIETPADLERARAYGAQQLRIELNLISILRSAGCQRIIEPLAVVRWPGMWLDDEVEREKCWWEPTYAYLMPAFERGSVSTLLGDICHRRMPDTTAASDFLSYRVMSRELAALMRDLHTLHTADGAQLMLQDLTPNNLLVDCSGDGVRLLFSDPAMALPIGLLAKPHKCHSVMGTWLWGSMAARNRRFDAHADTYSLCITFAEMWLVAEGATLPPMELISLLGIDADRDQAVQFLRALMVEVVKTRFHGGTIEPRVKSHLPIAWLGCWVLLLGFRDFRCKQHMEDGLPCLRPKEEEMMELVQRWACIASAAQDLPPDLTTGRAKSSAWVSVASDMNQLFRRLKELSHLKDAGPQADPELEWLAANFMEQGAPLVAAMKQMGAVGEGSPGPLMSVQYARRGWPEAVQAAQAAVHHASSRAGLERLMRKHREELAQGSRDAQALAALGQWYEEVNVRFQQGIIPAEAAMMTLPPAPLRLACQAAAARLGGNTNGAVATAAGTAAGGDGVTAARVGAAATAAGPAAHVPHPSADPTAKQQHSDSAGAAGNAGGASQPQQGPALALLNHEVQGLLRVQPAGARMLHNVLTGAAARREAEALLDRQGRLAPPAPLKLRQAFRKGVCDGGRSSGRGGMVPRPGQQQQPAEQQPAQQPAQPELDSTQQQPQLQRTQPQAQVPPQQSQMGPQLLATGQPPVPSAAIMPSADGAHPMQAADASPGKRRRVTLSARPAGSCATGTGADAAAAAAAAAPCAKPAGAPCQLRFPLNFVPGSPHVQRLVGGGAAGSTNTAVASLGFLSFPATSSTAPAAGSPIVARPYGLLDSAAAGSATGPRNGSALRPCGMGASAGLTTSSPGLSSGISLWASSAQISLKKGTAPSDEVPPSVEHVRQWADKLRGLINPAGPRPDLFSAINTEDKQVAFLRWLAGKESQVPQLLGQTMRFDQASKSKYISALLGHIDESKDVGRLTTWRVRGKYTAVLRQAALLLLSEAADPGTSVDRA